MSKSFSPLIAATALTFLVFSGVQAAPPKPSHNPQVEMTIENRGKITIELYAKEAPKTVAHFQGLANKKFYNGIRFHRVIPGFMDQTGDPSSKKFKQSDLAGKTEDEVARLGLGVGGSGKNIPFEANKRTHEPGTLSMALNAPRSDTGDSQFFINTVPNHRLDGDYCVFGKVVKGMDVVNKIKQGDKIVSILPVSKK
jgi:cyclophilin family peptidyl-prolyl cis-trans isomerase